MPTKVISKMLKLGKTMLLSRSFLCEQIPFVENELQVFINLSFHVLIFLKFLARY